MDQRNPDQRFAQADEDLENNNDPNNNHEEAGPADNGPEEADLEILQQPSTSRGLFGARGRLMPTTSNTVKTFSESRGSQTERQSKWEVKIEPADKEINLDFRYDDDSSRDTESGSSSEIIQSGISRSTEKQLLQSQFDSDEDCFIESDPKRINVELTDDEVSNQLPSTSSGKRPKLSIGEEHLHGPFDFSAHRKDKASRQKPEQNGDVPIARRILQQRQKTFDPPNESRGSKDSLPFVQYVSSTKKRKAETFWIDRKSSRTRKSSDTEPRVNQSRAPPRQEPQGRIEDLPNRRIERIMRLAELPEQDNPRNQRPTWPYYVIEHDHEPGFNFVRGEGTLPNGNNRKLLVRLKRVDQGVMPREIERGQNLVRNAGPTLQPVREIRVDQGVMPREIERGQNLVRNTGPTHQPVREIEEVIIEENDANDGDSEPAGDLYSKFETLVSLFPKLDPEFLHTKAREFSGKDNEFSNWVEATLENQSGLPSREQYDLKSQRAKQIKKYKREISVKELLDLYGDPEAHFLDIASPTSDIYRRNSLAQLKKDYEQLKAGTIAECFRDHNFHYLPTFLALNGYNGVKQRNPSPEINSEEHLVYAEDFLKEMQYASKRLGVIQYLADKSRDREQRVTKARNDGQLVECECCRNDECLVEEMLSCEGGHLSCKDCIKKASEVAIGDGKTALKCLTRCDQQFSLATLQKVLHPSFFSRWLQKIQMEELRKADIEGLETCPFCPFATIYEVSPEELRVFSCLNPDCRKESCRLCKQKSHIPLRCEEVEQDDEVRARTFIENKMTEALVRKCNRCDRPYVKLDGCNKITCDNCGALMCYICREPVTNYSHFYGQGADPTQTQKCPLWSDSGRVHHHDVVKGAMEAKREVQKSNPNVQLKNDPTAGMDLQNPPPAAPKKKWILPPYIPFFGPQDNLDIRGRIHGALLTGQYLGMVQNLNNPFRARAPPPAHDNYLRGLGEFVRQHQNVAEQRPPLAHQGELGQGPEEPVRHAENIQANRGLEALPLGLVRRPQDGFHQVPAPGSFLTEFIRRREQVQAPRSIVTELARRSVEAQQAQDGIYFYRPDQPLPPAQGIDFLEIDKAIILRVLFKRVTPLLIANERAEIENQIRANLDTACQTENVTILRELIRANKAGDAARNLSLFLMSLVPQRCRNPIAIRRAELEIVREMYMHQFRAPRERVQPLQYLGLQHQAIDQVPQPPPQRPLQREGPVLVQQNVVPHLDGPPRVEPQVGQGLFQQFQPGQPRAQEQPNVYGRGPPPDPRNYRDLARITRRLVDLHQRVTELDLQQQRVADFGRRLP